MKQEIKDDCASALQTKTGEFVVKYLEERLKEVQNDLMSTLELPYIHRLQGRAYELQDLIKLYKRG